jgi:hypothetical protein
MDGSKLFNHSARARGVLVGLLALLLCGAFAGVAQATLTAAPFDGTNFQAGDGNQNDPDGAGALRDWENIAGDVVSVVDVDADNPIAGFTGGSKETVPGDWELTDIGSPPKDDILNAWATTEVVGGHTILYMAFRRLAPNGNTFLTFELNQRTETWDNDDDASTPEIPCREDGDVLISYEVEPGGTEEPDPVTIRLYFWVEDTEDPDTGCSASGHFTGGDVLNDPTDAAPLAQAAINEDGDIENFLDTDGDGDFDADDIQEFEQGTFGEAAIDVSAVFDAIGEPCFDFGQIQLHSRASSEISSELKDFAGPLGVPVGACTASGVKFEDLDADGQPREEGEPGLEGWIIFADYNDNGVLDAGEPSDVTDENGAYLIDDLSQEYTLRELPGPDVTGTWICSYPNDESTPDGSGSLDDSDFPCGWGPIDPNEDPSVERDFGNYQKATITLVKQLEPSGDAGRFDLFVDGTADPLADDAGDEGSGFAAFDPGTYAIHEAGGTQADDSTTSLGNYDTTVSCELNGEALGDDANGTSRGGLVLESGDSLVCTFTNTRKTGKLTVEKDLIPTDDPGLFDLRIENEVVVEDASDGDSDSRVLPTGDYDVSELAGTGTDLDDYNSKVECDNGQSADPGTSLANVHVTDDSDITCTFTNTRKTGKLTVEKVLVPDTDDGLFDLKIEDEVVVEDASHGDSGFRVLPTGDYDISELAGTGTSLDDYSSKVECDNEQGADPGTSLDNVHVTDGSDITCTFTNARNPGHITVVKRLISDDPKESGTFDLKVDATVVKAGAGDGDSGSTNVSAGTHEVSEGAAGATVLAHYESSIECVDGEETVASGEGTSIDVDVASNQEITCTITNEAILNPDIEVDKKIRDVTLGGTFVDTPPDIDTYVGDTLEYQFTVTNPGNVALAVTIEDPRCDAGTLAGPTGAGTGDGLLDPGESWVYTCTHLVTAGDPDPLPNTVTATGTVPETERPPVTDTDSAEADVFHPAIDIAKTGPATATAGAVLNYTLTVKNTGDIPFASDKVVVTDPGCDDMPTLTSKNGDASPGFLDPAVDTWTYVCSHQTATTDSSFTNTANVTGTDRNGRTATDTASFPTALSAVLPETIVNGTARLRGPSGCVKGKFKATVRGSRISRVTFFVDGKRFKRLTAPTGEGSRFTVRINPKGRGFGVHRVTARVEFVEASQTKTRTLRLSFQRCKKQVVKPRFTG